MNSIPLSKPRSALATVLYGLITREKITERDYPFNGFRSRLSELRRVHELPVRFKEVKGENQFGNPMVYKVHYLWKISLPKAARLYKKINSNG